MLSGHGGVVGNLMNGGVVGLEGRGGDIVDGEWHGGCRGVVRLLRSVFGRGGMIRGELWRRNRGRCRRAMG